MTYAERRAKKHDPKQTAFEALAWVNEQRNRRGLGSLAELLPGRRRSWTFCPIARSLAEGGTSHVRASTWEVAYRDEETLDGDPPQETVKPPVAVRNFIEAFDVDGAYPELEFKPVLAFTG